jgi:hypothetical protein
VQASNAGELGQHLGPTLVGRLARELISQSPFGGCEIVEVPKLAEAIVHSLHSRRLDGRRFFR